MNATKLPDLIPGKLYYPDNGISGYHFNHLYVTSFSKKKVILFLGKIPKKEKFILPKTDFSFEYCYKFLYDSKICYVFENPAFPKYFIEILEEK